MIQYTDMQQLSDTLTSTVRSVFGAQDIAIDLSLAEPQFGDFSCNVAMKLSKILGKSPLEIAEHIRAEMLNQNIEWLKEIVVAGPGFLNFTLTDAALWQQAISEPLASLKGESIVLEYSCPNAFKELHSGHLYQTLVGDVLGNMLIRAGAQVTRTNFGGDVGLHVAKSMWGVFDLLQGFEISKLEEMPRSEHASFLSKAYVHGATMYEQDEAVKLQVEGYNKQIYELHANDDSTSSFAKVYWLCRTWSYEYFKDFYESIEVSPFNRYYPESETAPIGLDLVRSANGVFEQSDGATIFRGEAIGLHTRVFITRENLPTYETKDLGVIKLEYDEFAFEQRILITGNDQSEYMKVVFAAAEQVLPNVAHKMRHLTNGTIRFGDGQKMSSRLGNVSRAIDVIDGASELVEADNDELKKILSLGAVKYSFLKQRFGVDIAFDLEESVSLHGNSGPYLQYAYVRAHSILQKAENLIVIPEFTASERLFVQKLSQFEIVMHSATQELAQQIICTYLYELAQNFNRFYEDNRVLDDERQSVRLMLVRRYADILQDGLRVLGIRVPEKM